MAKFNAATAVEALDFDFTAFGGPEGTIPEPSTKQVTEFFTTIRGLAIDLQRFQASKTKEIEAAHADDDDDALPSDEEVVSIIAEADTMTDAYQARLKDALVEVASGAYSQDDLTRLPYRVFQAFSAWLGEAIRPEARTPATTP